MELPSDPVVVWTLLGTLLGVILGFSLTAIKDALRENEERRRLAASLHAELTVLLHRYEEVFGKHIRAAPQGQPMPWLGGVALSQNFFTVFDKNANILGLFQPSDAEAVIRAYVLGKAHLESINQVAMQRVLYEDRIVRLAGSPAAIFEQGRLDALLISAVDLFKKESAEVIEAVQNATTVLQRYAGTQ